MCPGWTQWRWRALRDSNSRPSGFVGGFCATRQHTPYNKNQRNQREERKVLGWHRLVLYPVHGQLHGQNTAGLGEEIQSDSKSITIGRLTIDHSCPRPRQYRPDIHAGGGFHFDVGPWFPIALRRYTGAIKADVFYRRQLRNKRITHGADLHLGSPWSAPIFPAFQHAPTSGPMGIMRKPKSISGVNRVENPALNRVKTRVAGPVIVLSEQSSSVSCNCPISLSHRFTAWDTLSSLLTLSFFIDLTSRKRHCPTF